MNLFSFFVSVLSFNLFFSSPFLVDGPSMEPTFYSGDVLLVEEMALNGLDYERSDVVVFTLESDPDYFYVKRIVGLPGERVKLRPDGIYVGKYEGAEIKLEEPYLTSSVALNSYRPNFSQTFVIPTGAYFVAGDNRAQSFDSRSFSDPFVKKEEIKGKVSLRLFKAPWARFGQPRVVVETDKGEVSFVVEVADSIEERQLGLMFREDLAARAGMWFIFDDAGEKSFWMKNTLIPLDMLFFNDSYELVHIVKKAQPCQEDDCEIYSSQKPARYVLEIPGGQSEAFGIEEGFKAKFIP